MADICISSLSKYYGETKVLHNLDLTVKDGEFLTLLGSSGCGKSTLLKLIAGLEEPSAGSISIGEQDLSDQSPSKRNCAMVFQSYALYPHMTVLENICTPLLMRGLHFWQRLPGASFFSAAARKIKKNAVMQATEIANSLGIGHLLTRKPAQLSGGQRQRVALARAMVRRPSVFLFDEPLSNLDANLRQSLRTEIRRLHDMLGVTFIYVTHDQHEAMSMSDRVAVMREGNILQLASPHEIYEEPANLDVARFVGSPRINLIQANIHDGHVFFGTTPIGQCDSANGPCTIGFRPQAVSDTYTPGLSIHGEIQALEYTGTDVLTTVHLSLVNEDIVCSLSAKDHSFQIKEQLTLYIAFNDLHLFDHNGNRNPSFFAPLFLSKAAQR